MVVFNALNTSDDQLKLVLKTLVQWVGDLDRRGFRGMAVITKINCCYRGVCCVVCMEILDDAGDDEHLSIGIFVDKINHFHMMLVWFAYNEIYLSPVMVSFVALVIISGIWVPSESM